MLSGARVWLAIALLLRPNLAHPQTEAPIFGTTVVVPSGLQGLIYFIRKGTGRLPGFSTRDAIGTIYTTSLNVPPRHFRQGFPGVTDRFEWFAIDYSGQFWIDQPGPYSFRLTSDDGAKLFVDGQLKIDNDGIHSARTRSAKMVLRGGIHRIRVCYFQGPQDYIALVLELLGPDGNWQVFSTDSFKPPSDPEQWKYGNVAEIGSNLPSALDSQAVGKARKAFVAGVAALVDGNLKDAEKHLKRATKVLPSYAQAWSALGQTWENQSNTEQARRAYERALIANADYAPAAVRLARLDLVQLHDAAALEVTRPAIAQQTNNPLIYFYDAVANTHLKDFDAAEKSARRAIELDMLHEVPQAHYVLGISLGQKGDVAGALEHMRIYLAMLPNAGDAEEVRARIIALERTAGAAAPIK
ncbi:MAG: PA14 domain-containing protein [Bryobacteraceae bacterium]